MSSSAFDKLIWDKINFFYPASRPNSFLHLAYSFFCHSQVTKKKKKNIFKDAELSLEKGKAYALLSPNGTGKTTLFRLLAGILPGVKTNTAPKILSFIDSTAPFISNISVELNIKIFQNIHGYSEDDQSVREILTLASLCEERKQRIDQLSSGMTSRLCLGLLEFNQADLYLIDEIFSFADKKVQQKTKEIIQTKKNEGAVFIIAGHNTNFIKECCDQGLEIQEGKIILYQSVENLITQYDQRCLQS